ncbi:Na+/H+ antiporter subunit E [Quadrisphaera sp. DSM 44207]|uniref:Na+/H+ antiporter subunit E n=1 Tax=Quadrisphaera sp. DSM 44207 TaxID=1881057 RepID=UPI0008812D98|nr:Na+/H+ antiporter subunit E [Quadrisphaera sp. DSM 44207]SDQ41459.1 multicomponent Na+:H+ antiporter subunit E [Quadrisphaera sp. DSM 44207]
MGLVLRVLGLTAVYLLVLTSLAPGDVLVGLVLSTAVALAVRRLEGRDPSAQPVRPSVASRLAGVPALVLGTVVDVAAGTVEVVRYCLAPQRWPHAGVVTVPVDLGSPSSAAAWAVRVGIAPDSIVVDVDGERGELLLHVRDASDPDAVRAAQLDSYRRRQQRVFP